MQAPRIIAFYLPQFHPIPENDEWWGKGFTEWTNVGKAKKFFPGHYQPRVPADLGYYDLRVSETREAQAKMAREAGIEGFCYWHYWFGNGKRLLERPFNEVLESGKPDFPFCLAWANHDWKMKTWIANNQKDKLLIKQEYGGIEDYTHHFYTLLDAFTDKRYIKIDGKPVFVIYDPLGCSEIILFIETWRKLAQKNKLEGIYFIGQCNNVPQLNNITALDFDAVNVVRLGDFWIRKPFLLRIPYGVYRRLFKRPYIHSYKAASKYFFDIKFDIQDHIIPTIITGWDNTPRSGKNGIVIKNYTPKLFKEYIQFVIRHTNKNPGIVFLKSWNEWAEGNYLEPDLKWGRQFLNVLADVIKETENEKNIHC